MSAADRTYDENIGDNLAQVNLARVACGFPPLNELPDAAPGVSTDCLFFRGLSDVGARGVGTGTIELSSERQAQMIAELWGTRAEGRNADLPQGIRRTINVFDKGQIPHYNV